MFAQIKEKYISRSISFDENDFANQSGKHSLWVPLNSIKVVKFFVYFDLTKNIHFWSSLHSISIDTEIFSHVKNAF